MCLYKKKRNGQIAKEDIVCYKILKKCDNNCFRTPYLLSYVDNDIVKGLKPFGPGENGKISKKYEFCKYPYIITSGYIHTFKNLEDAKLTTYQLLKQLFVPSTHPYKEKYTFKVFKCVIPQGVKYHEGTADDAIDIPSYASKEIKFIKEIKLKYDIG